ncbi:MAG: NAD(P)H-binding protein [Nitrospirota bacterium]
MVTGAFGYTGKYIAGDLLAAGRTVKTITGHPDRPDPFGGRVKAKPFNFDNPAGLARSLEGASTLYNTYWIRFPRGEVTYDSAVENTKALLNAARDAGVRRLVHISIANAAEDSPYPYYRGKARLERFIRESGFSYAIVRPTVLFGHEGILINNIAWLIRRFPVFQVPGSGEYRLQPVHVEDVADIAVRAGGSGENIEVDAAGPEAYAFNELVELVKKTVGSRARIIHMGPETTLLAAGLVGRLLGDVLITRDELYGLMDNLLVSGQPPQGRVSLGEWLRENADSVGRQYASELKRHYR